MQKQLNKQQLQAYLQTDEIVDWQTVAVKNKASELAQGKKSGEEKAQACFEFVRDEIKHSLDFQLNPVTLKASDVLKFGTGYCYAKSHLLAALLRANSIAAGLCYQRLCDGDGHCLHGLNSVYLPQHGWYRLDARGNKVGVQAEFMPPTEQLAFPISGEGEADLEGIFATPLKSVVELLSQNRTFQAVAESLPDVDPRDFNNRL